MADDRTYIRVHDGIEDHPKTAVLSDKAFRLLVTTWGWCSRHLTDGRVPLAVWKKRGTPKVRAELVAAGLVENHDGFVMMHDYLEHQRSSALVEEKREAKRRGARLGNHNRWHRDQGVYEESCEFCVDGEPPEPEEPEPTGKRSHSDQSSESHKRSGSDRKTSPETETETEKELKDFSTRPPESNARPKTPPGASGPNSTRAFRLVNSVLGRDLTSATKTALTIEVAQLLAEVDESTIAAALERWNQRTNIGPRLLPGLVDDIRKEARGATSHPPRTTADPRPSTTDQRVAAVLALARPEPDQPPNRLQLPGAAS